MSKRKDKLRKDRVDVYLIQFQIDIGTKRVDEALSNVSYWTLHGRSAFALMFTAITGLLFICLTQIQSSPAQTDTVKALGIAYSVSVVKTL